MAAPIFIVLELILVGFDIGFVDHILNLLMFKFEGLYIIPISQIYVLLTLVASFLFLVYFPTIKI